uniref:Uncharacterized protein n=1 Tax=Caenorhabditis japonica TaxID=281687 RepID=A0A8R1DWZ7_CAEJA
MCVTRPSARTSRRSFRAPIDQHSSFPSSLDNSRIKLGDSNFRSTVFQNRVNVWVLPLNLSQSKYGGRQTPSSACTLITVQIAYDFLTQNIRLPPTSPLNSKNLPLDILGVLINAIVDGNETHEKAMMARKRGFSGCLKKTSLEQSTVPECPSVFQFLKKPYRDTFTVPEAIQAHRPEMHEVDYKCYSGDFISNLVTAITMAVTSPWLRDLSRLSIGVLAFERAMCFIYDRPTHSILLIDTHMHFKGRAGSVVCVASFDDVTDFIVGVTKLVFQEVFKTADVTGQFEITCLMLTSLMNKVHRGQIFQPIKTNSTKSFPLTAPVKVKARKSLKVAKPTDENDSGYESDTEHTV